MSKLFFIPLAMSAAAFLLAWAFPSAAAAGITTTTATVAGILLLAISAALAWFGREKGQKAEPPKGGDAFATGAASKATGGDAGRTGSTAGGDGGSAYASGKGSQAKGGRGGDG